MKLHRCYKRRWRQRWHVHFIKMHDSPRKSVIAADEDGGATIEVSSMGVDPTGTTRVGCLLKQWGRSGFVCEDKGSASNESAAWASCACGGAVSKHANNPEHENSSVSQ